jgi:hypothetical protein
MILRNDAELYTKSYEKLFNEFEDVYSVRCYPLTETNWDVKL